MTTPEYLHRCANELLERCDGASTLDGQGFSRYHFNIGKSFAETDPSEWTDRTTYNAYTLLHHYRKQLGSYGWPIERVEKPPKPKLKKETVQFPSFTYDDRTLDYEDGHYKMSVPRELFDDLKEIFKEKKRVPSHNLWLIPANKKNSVLVERFAYGHGINITSLAADQISSLKGRPTRFIMADEGYFLLEFPFNRTIVNELQNIGTWDGKYKIWKVSANLTNIETLLSLVERFDFELDVGVLDQMFQVIDDGHEAIELSRSLEVSDVTEGLRGKLRPYQEAGVKYLTTIRKAILGDQAGTGKTFQSLASAHVLEGYPIIIVCPATAVFNWAVEAYSWLPNTIVGVLIGRKIKKSPNVNLVSKHDEPFKCLVNNLGMPNVLVMSYGVVDAHLEALQMRGFKTLIVDESHKVKSEKAKRSVAVYKLSRDMENVFLLSGTPIVNRPSELIHQLMVIDKLDEFGGKFRFLRRYCGYKPKARYHKEEATHLEELNRKLRSTCMIRRLKKDVNKELPPIVHTPIILSLSNRREYDKAEADPIQYLFDKMMSDTELIEEIKNSLRFLGKKFTLDYLREVQLGIVLDKTERMKKAKHLVRIAVLRQLAAKGKLDATVKWVKDFESSEKLVIFATHRSIQNELVKKFKCLHVLGDDSLEDRQKAVRKFQTDPNEQLIVCSLRAASEAITLHAASNVVFVEYDWTPAQIEQAYSRVHRFGQDAESVNVWYMEGHDTIDQDTIALLERKRKVIEASSDGSLTFESDTKNDIEELMSLMEQRINNR